MTSPSSTGGRRPGWWRRLVDPPPGSALAGQRADASLRWLAAAVALAWLPPIALGAYLIVTVVFGVLAVLLLPCVPPFVFGVRVARGRMANPDLGAWGVIVGGCAAAAWSGSAINEQWFHDNGRPGDVVFTVVGAVWSAAAAAGAWQLRRRLLRLERRLALVAPPRPAPSSAGGPG